MTMTLTHTPAPLSLPSVNLEEVTPERAAEYLSHNVLNRALKKQRVLAYARDMRAGAWQLTGEAIKFSSTGSLLDGQNRLHAVVAAGVPVTMLVVRGLALESQEVMDSGVARTSADAAHLRGIPNSGTVAAAAKILHGYRTDVYTAALDDSSTSMTNTEVLAFLAANPAILDVVPIAKRLGAKFRMRPSALVAAISILREVDAEQADEFLSLFEDMRSTGPGDPIYTLLLRVNSDAAANRRVAIGAHFYYIFRTWNAWVAGEDLSRLITVRSGQATPIPVPLTPER